MKIDLKNIVTAVLLFASSAVWAQPKKVVADRIIAIVGNKIVLQSDIENNLQDMARQGMDIPENAKCFTLEQNMGIKALVLQAEKDSLPVTDEEIDADIELHVVWYW